MRRAPCGKKGPMHFRFAGGCRFGRTVKWYYLINMAKTNNKYTIIYNKQLIKLQYHPSGFTLRCHFSRNPLAKKTYITANNSLHHWFLKSSAGKIDLGWYNQCFKPLELWFFSPSFHADETAALAKCRVATVQMFKIPRPLFWSKHNSASHTTHTHQDSQWSLTLDLTKPNIDITSNLRAHVLYDQSFASLRSHQPSGSAPQQPRVLEKLDRWSYLSIMSDQLGLSTRNQTGWRFWTERILVKSHHHHKNMQGESKQEHHITNRFWWVVSLVVMNSGC